MKIYNTGFDSQLLHTQLYEMFFFSTICSSLKLVYIFSVNPHLGPLQVSLSRMVTDIMKFFFLYVLVLFAFSCGLNQLLWYYADMEKKRCPTAMLYPSSSGSSNVTTDSNACIVWRRFAKYVYLGIFITI